MFYVYVLRSLKNEQLYFGYTSDLRKRLAEHNAGKSFSTRTYKPWKLVYYEAFLSEADAKEREQQLKHFGQTLSLLKRRISRSLNLR